MPPLPRYAFIYHRYEISFTVTSISKQMMEVVENVFTLTVGVLTQTAKFFHYFSRSLHVQTHNIYFSNCFYQLFKNSTTVCVAKCYKIYQLHIGGPQKFGNFHEAGAREQEVVQRVTADFEHTGNRCILGLENILVAILEDPKNSVIFTKQGQGNRKWCSASLLILNILVIGVTFSYKNWHNTSSCGFYSFYVSRVNVARGGFVFFCICTFEFLGQNS